MKIPNRPILKHLISAILASHVWGQSFGFCIFQFDSPHRVRIPQVIVGIVDGDGKDEPAPKFAKVGGRPGPLPHHELDDLLRMPGTQPSVSIGPPNVWSWGTLAR